MTSSSRQEGAKFHSRDVHSLPSLLPPFSAPTPPLHCANRGERGLLVSSQRIPCLQYQFHPFHSSFLCICGSRSQHQQSHDFLRKRKCILHLHHHCPTKNPSVKTLLSIGGGSSNKTQYSSMATQASSRKAFIDSSISVARSNGFSGLDLDWEYPTTTTDMSNFGTLLTEWRAAVANESKNSGKAALLLTAAVYYASKIEGLSYPVSSISASLDWINAMAYDFYGPGWSQVTRLPAQLYDPGSQYNGNYGIVDWIQAGLSAKKIVLGFPFYGYAWRLVNANNHGLFAATSGAATAGDGSMGYNQIRQVMMILQVFPPRFRMLRERGCSVTSHGTLEWITTGSFLKLHHRRGARKLEAGDPRNAEV
ncbi:Chitotriosidase-1 [Vitis vinifera]|uniref:Chitotriosidase-1 n=1 Tax=Vitis vinifera TaxID=29760 RepID=A0A438J8J0_VITVI|nr:Chitotriosidase-1 [Vitis vinifera]